MGRVIIIAILIALAAIGGFFSARFTMSNYVEFKLMLPDTNQKDNLKFSTARNLACAAVAVANAFEIKMDHAGFAAAGFKEANVQADKYSLGITADGKSLLLLSTWEVENGATDAGEQIPITSSGGSYVVASRAAGLDVTTIILDLKTLRGIISYTGQGMLGMKGRSVLVSCR